MADETDALRRNMADLGGMAENAERSDAAIRDAAAERLDAVNRRLDELRPMAATDETAGFEYSDLIAERGRLSLVLAKA